MVVRGGTTTSTTVVPNRQTSTKPPPPTALFLVVQHIISSILLSRVYSLNTSSCTTFQITRFRSCIATPLHWTAMRLLTSVGHDVRQGGRGLDAVVV